MKTRFLMLAMMMCMTALTFSACSDDDDDDKSIDVPEAVTQALKQKYPSATDVDWKYIGMTFPELSRLHLIIANMQTGYKMIIISCCIRCNPCNM